MLELESLLRTIGYLGIFMVIFAESGVFFGFFLPGSSLLFTAGFLASQGIFHIWILVVVAVLGAILGDSFGYAFGKKVGPMLFKRDDSIFFHKDHVIRAERFYEKHGKVTVLIGRLIPIVRTFVPIIAGVGKMHYPTFLVFNIVGGVAWATGLTLGGFYFGRIVPDPDRYLLPIVAIVVVLSLFPIIPQLWRAKKK